MCSAIDCHWVIDTCRISDEALQCRLHMEGNVCAYETVSFHSREIQVLSVNLISAENFQVPSKGNIPNKSPALYKKMHPYSREAIIAVVGATDVTHAISMILNDIIVMVTLKVCIVRSLSHQERS